MAGRRALLGLGGGAIVVALIGLAWSLRGEDRAAPSTTAQSARSAASRTRGATAAPSTEPAALAVEPAPTALPGSLEGTEADGALEADASGHLRVTLELRRLFDHYLAASGEEPLATMRARIVAALAAKLPATAAAEAAAILDRYLGYREAARGLAPGSDPKAGLDAVHALRAQWFAPEVARAFFAEEEAATYAALERRDVLADRGLTAAERDRRLAELEARLPARVRAAREAALAPIKEMQHEEQLRAAGASEAQITASRTAAFGADGAARLAELDKAHAAWDAKLAQFRAARAAIAGDAQLDAAERDRRVEALLAQSFTPQEQLRVRAIEHLAAPQ